MDARKMLAVAAAIVGTAAMATDSSISSSVVGYNTINHNEGGTPSPLFGMCFTPIGEKAYLGDYKPVDGTLTVDDDCIQVIDPTSLNTAGFFTYLDKTTADAIAIEEGGEAGDLDDQIGWWDEVIGVFEDDAKVDDYPVPAGFGFMGFFMSGNEVTFQLPSSTAVLD